MNPLMLVKTFFKGLIATMAIVVLLAGGMMGGSRSVYGADGFPPPTTPAGNSGISVEDTVSLGLTAFRLLSGDFTAVGGLLGGGGESKDVNVKSSTPEEKRVNEEKAVKNITDALYKTIMGLIRTFTAKMVGDTFDWVQKGFPGQGPAFYTEPWDTWMPNIFNSAGAFFIEGVIDGFVQDHKESEYITRYTGDRLALEALSDQCQQEVQTLNDDCDGGDILSCKDHTIKLRECELIQEQINKLITTADLFFAQQQQHRDNARLDLQGAISPEAENFMQSLVCTPSPSLTLRIGLGLFPGTGPATRQPVCQLTEAFSNWSNLIQRTGNDVQSTGWKTLGSFFDPNSTELGITFNAQMAQYEYQQQVSLEELFKRQTETPYKNVTDTVSGNIKTPGSIVGNAVAKALDESAKPNQLTGNPIVDGLSIVLESVTDTLYGKLTQSFKDGIVTAKKWSLYGGDVFKFSPIPAAQQSLTKFSGTVKFVARDNMDITNQLLSTDSSNPDANTIGNGLALALQKGMTVRDAINKGHLKDTAMFGFDATGKEPSVKDGNLPYRSLVILRKYRVVPVTWEYAALYIQHTKGQACGTGKSCTLKDMIDAFDDVGSPFRGLVDENWVLKIPPSRCELEGYGPTNIVNTVTRTCKFDTNGDGVVDCSGNEKAGATNNAFDVLVPQVTRNQVCVDQQSCLETDSSGNCVQGRYGYCIQEQQTWNFRAESCEPQYSSCRAFTNEATGASLSVLTSSLQGYNNNTCSAESAGCHWVSSVRNAGNDKNTKPWISDESAKVYLNAKAESIACDESGEGCEAVTNTTAGGGQTEYFKIAPSDLKCSFADGGYQKTQCEPFVTQCAADHVGCDLYTSTEDESSMAGKNPRSCNASCVGLGVYTQAATQFDAAVANVPFIAETAQQCSAADVGCEEFTNLSNETKVYFKEVQSCVQTPVAPDAPTPFYTWYGSDTSGFKLSVVNIQPDTAGNPSCGTDPLTNTPYTCTCSKAIFDAQRADPLTSGFACREYINKAGAVSYRYSSQVLYQTDDCSQMRRSSDQAAYNFSPSHSLSCTPQAAGCRLYQGTQAGNTAAILVSDFESGTTDGWAGNGISNSNENVLLNGKSLRVTGDGTVNVSHSTTLHDGYSYVATMEIKGAPNGSVRAAFGYADPATALPMGTVTLNAAGDWQQVTFSLPAVRFEGSEKEALFTITPPAGTSYIDNIVIREAQGIYYAVKDKLNVPSSCQAIIAPAGIVDQAKLGEQLNCKLYTDRAGTSQPLTGVGQLCPLAVVGCNAFTVTPGKGESYNTHFVVDNNKRCDQSQQSCKAYGVPTVDPQTGAIPQIIQSKDVSGAITSTRELWTTAYYKIKDDDASKAAQCTAEQDNCQAFSDADGQHYFKDPRSNTCTWTVNKTNPTGKWVKKGTTNEDCPTQAAQLCPETEDYCRAVGDPECSDGQKLRTNYGSAPVGQGNACTPQYYIKEQPAVLAKRAADECKGNVDPSIGCLLFDDPAVKGKTYDAFSHYAMYAAQTPKKGISPNPANNQGAANANALYKVDLDRQCKIWLACTSSVRVADNGSATGSKDICLQRRPCQKWGTADEPCQEFVPNADPTSPINPVLYGLYQNTDGDTAIARTLSGIARPNFTFNVSGSAPFTVTGGHDSTFAWAQNLSTPDPAKDNRPTATLTGITNNVGNLLNSCRLYPQEDAPIAWAGGKYEYWRYIDENGVLVTPQVPIDACYYKDQNIDRQQGLYGYCLEPYPQYYGSGVSGGQYGDSRNIEAGYQNYCLNWHPVGYISGQSNVLGGEHPIPAYQGTKPLYYCVQSKGGAKGFDSTMPASTNIVTEYAVKTRDTSIFRFAAFGYRSILRNTSGIIAEYKDNKPLASNVDIAIIDGRGIGEDELTVPSYKSPTSGSAQLLLTFSEAPQGTVTCEIRDDAVGPFVSDTGLFTYSITPDSSSLNGASLTANQRMWKVQVSKINETHMGEDKVSVLPIQCQVGNVDIPLELGGVPVHLMSQAYTANKTLVSSQARVTFSNNGVLSVPMNGISFLNAPRENFGYMDVTVSNIPNGMRVTCDLEKGSLLGDWGFEGERQKFERDMGLNYFKVPPFPVAETLGIWDWSYRTNNYIPNTNWDVKDGKYSALAVGGDSNGGGSVRFTIVAENQSNTASVSRQKNLYCSFDGSNVDINSVMFTEDFLVTVGNTSAAAFFDNIVASAGNVLTQIKTGLIGTVSNVNKKLASTGEVVRYRIAGVNPSPSIPGTRYEVIKPAFNLSSSSINFTLDEILENKKKPVTVRANPSPRTNIDQFAWRAVVDTSNTPRVNVGGGYISSLFYITPGTEKGESGNQVDITFKRELLNNLPSGTYKGAIKIYAMAPIEGMFEGNTEQTLWVNLTIPNTAGLSTKLTEGTPLEPSPDASTVRDTFGASVRYTNLDADLNDGRVTTPITNPPTLKNGTAPVYAPNSDVRLTLYAGNSISQLCQTASSNIQARLIYSYTGEGAWRGIPEATIGSNGQIVRNFQKGTCQGINFILKSGQGSGIQYYFIAENPVKGVSVRSEVFYIDVKTLAEVKGTITDEDRETDVLNNPISTQLRDPKYGIGDTVYTPRSLSLGALQLSSLVTEAERLLAYKNYDYSDYYCNTNSGSTGGFSQSCYSTEIRTVHDYGIDEVTSSNKPAPYCGEGKPCEDIEWLAPKEETGDTSGPRTRIQTSSDVPQTNPILQPGQGTGSNPVFIHTETENPDEVNKKFLPTDTQYTTQPYQGNVKVRVKTTYSYRYNSSSYTSCPAEGACSYSFSSSATTCDTESCVRTSCDEDSCSNGEPTTGLSPTGYLNDVSASLVVRPQIDVPETIDLTPAHTVKAYPLPVNSKPLTTNYHWRASIIKQDPIKRRDNGDFNWLSISPSAGISGTNISLSVAPEAAQFAVPGTSYKAEIKINATSPVDGTASKVVLVTFQAPAANAVVTIANVSNDGGSYSTPTNEMRFEQLAGEDSVMVLFSRESSAADSRRVALPNAFEKVIHKDQIAQIDYTIEHRTRNTLPGVNWASSDIQGVSEATSNGRNNLTKTYTISNDLDLTNFFTPKLLWSRGAGLLAGNYPSPDDDPAIAISEVTSNYDSYTAALPNINRPVIATTEQTNMYTMVLNSANTQDVKPENAFSAQCHGRKDGDIGRDFAAIQPMFNDDGFIKGWNTRYCDDSGGQWYVAEGQQKYIFVTVTIYLKDYCTDVVQVVKEDGTAVPWRQKVMRAPKDSAGAPKINQPDGAFMSLIPPVGRPEKWSQPIPIINDNSTSIAHAQALTVAAAQKAVGSICLGGSKHGEMCTTSNDCTGSGKCFGSTADPSYGDAQLRQYFVRSYGQWSWDPKQRKYIKRSEPEGIYQYTGPSISPTIQSLDNNKALRDGMFWYTLHPNKRTVEINFNSEIDLDQKPLRKIEIDWGDSTGLQTLHYSDDDRPIEGSSGFYLQPRGSHHFTHTYSSNAGGKTVRVKITDNWGATAEASAVISN